MHTRDDAAGTASSATLGLRVEGTDADQHLRALFHWLSNEDELRGRLDLHRPPVPEGQLGALVDVLVVALGSGGAGAVLAQSISTWLTQRRADVKVTIAAPDGHTVTIDVTRARDPLAVIQEVERLIAPPPE